jgi:hypothetical protein
MHRNETNYTSGRGHDLLGGNTPFGHQQPTFRYSDYISGIVPHFELPDCGSSPHLSKKNRTRIAKEKSQS